MFWKRQTFSRTTIPGRKTDERYKITIHSDGTAQIEEPFCFCGEHNAARLCITLNDELKTDASYYLLSFDVYGLSRRIVSNIISGVNSTPAYVTGGVIYCPLPEALT